MLASVETVLRHRDIPQATQFAWYVDDKGLIYLLNKKPLPGRQGRSMGKIGETDFTVMHVPGAENILSARLYSNDASGECERKVDTPITTSLTTTH